MAGTIINLPSRDYDTEYTDNKFLLFAPEAELSRQFLSFVETSSVKPFKDKIDGLERSLETQEASPGACVPLANTETGTFEIGGTEIELSAFHPFYLHCTFASEYAFSLNM